MKDFSTKNILSENNENELQIFKNLLYLFFYMTMRLQGDSIIRSYRSAWEYLMAIEIIKEHFKKVEAKHGKVQQTGFLKITINTGLRLIQKYYEFITKNLVYIAAMVLNFIQNWHYFNAKQTKKEKQVQTTSY